MSKFHNSKEWQRLAKAHKQLSCSDCGSKKDIQSGHILAASRFPMSKLWMINLKHQCKPCNLNQGVKLQFNTSTIKLLVIYMLIKFIKNLFVFIVLVLLARYCYLDIEYNASTITNQIKSDVYYFYQKGK